jgi:HEAT repeat protein
MRRLLILALVTGLVGCKKSEPKVAVAAPPGPDAAVGDDDETLGEPNYVTIPLSRLLRQLRDGSASDREFAASGIASIGPEAEAAVPDLIRSLGDESKDVRARSAQALGAIGRGAAPALPHLIAAFRTDKERWVREASLKALGQIGVGDEKSVAALIDGLKDADPEIRSAARSGIGLLGGKAKAAVPALVEQMKTGQGSDPGYATYTLGQVGPGAEAAVPALLDVALRRIPGSQEAAQGALARVGPAAFAALRKALSDPDAEARRLAAGALVSFGPRAKDAVPELIALLTDEKSVLTAAGALKAIGPDAREAIPALRKAADGPDENAVAAAEAMLKIDPAHPETAAAVKKAVAAIQRKPSPAPIDHTWHLRELGDLGLAAVDALPYVRGRLGDRFNGPSAALALWKITGKADEAVAALVEFYRNPENPSFEREKALESLGDIGPDARGAVPTVIKALRTKETLGDSLRTAAAVALGKIGPAAKEAIPALLEALDDEKAYGLPEKAAIALGRIGVASKEVLSGLYDAGERVRFGGTAKESLEAFARFGPVAKPALPLVLKSLRQQHYPERLRAAEAYWKICGKTSLPVEALRMLLRSPDSTWTEDRVRAVVLLGEIGPKAKAAVPELEMMLEHPDPKVRAAAAAALEMVRGQG